jgi:hypothetical protein
LRIVKKLSVFFIKERGIGGNDPVGERIENIIKKSANDCEKAS